MSSIIRQNILLLILTILTLDMLIVSALGVFGIASASATDSRYDIIDCADGSGAVHKCIRVDAKAGEINNAATGASYRVIYGH